MVNLVPRLPWEIKSPVELPEHLRWASSFVELDASRLLSQWNEPFVRKAGKESGHEVFPKKVGCYRPIVAVNARGCAGRPAEEAQHTYHHG